MQRASYELSLKELVGNRAVKDIYGCRSTEFGDPMFKITRIELEDGTMLSVGGEHDMPYIEDDNGVISLPEDDDG